MSDLQSEIRDAWLELEPSALPISQWGHDAESALERMTEWSRREPPRASRWFAAFVRGEALPELTPEEAAVVVWRLDASASALDTMLLWEKKRLAIPDNEPMPAIFLPAPRAEFLHWLFEQVWSHVGFGNIADVLDNLSQIEWPQLDKPGMN